MNDYHVLDLSESDFIEIFAIARCAKYASVRLVWARKLDTMQMQSQIELHTEEGEPLKITTKWADWFYEETHENGSDCAFDGASESLRGKLKEFCRRVSA